MKNRLQYQIIKIKDSLKTKTRDNGEIFTYCAVDEYKDIVKYMHGTDFLPDDFRFETIQKLLCEILDRVNFYTVESFDDFEDQVNELSWEICDSLVSVYTRDLTTWLASNINRISYVDDARDEFGKVNMPLIEQLQIGQLAEIREILYNIMRTLKNNYETILEEAV